MSVVGCQQGAQADLEVATLRDLRETRPQVPDHQASDKRKKRSRPS